jgi:hypothetical protein
VRFSEGERAMTEPKRRSRKSKWMGSTDSGAYDPPTELELEALSLLGPHSIRDGAIEGVNDPVLDGSAGPLERPTDDELSAEQPGEIEGEATD